VLAVLPVFYSELPAIETRFAAETLARCRCGGENNSEENSETRAKQQHPFTGAAPLFEAANVIGCGIASENEW
jgi:hypothetical protein